jgi:hypothetical protein
MSTSPRASRRVAARKVVLQFDPALDRLPSGKRLSDGVSAAAPAGDTLWVAHDESVAVEALRGEITASGTLRFAAHRRYALRDFVRLPHDAKHEIDLEGLAFDGERLWVVGSHAARREGADGRSAREAIASLARVRRGGNRYLVACVPVVDGALVRKTGSAQAARLPGGRKHDALTLALRDDPHLAPFLALPSKDNGFDIEGVAAVPGGRRLLLGLRGPVIDGWACVLDVELRPRARRPRELAIVRYRKHFLDLGGAGIRDLCLAGRDVLVLTGPPMRGKGEATVRLWRDALRARRSSLVRRDRLPTLLELRYREKKDHAEGIAVLGRERDRVALLVLYDSASRKRRPAPAAMSATLHSLSLA